MDHGLKGFVIDDGFSLSNLDANNTKAADNNTCHG